MTGMSRSSASSVHHLTGASNSNPKISSMGSDTKLVSTDESSTPPQSDSTQQQAAGSSSGPTTSNAAVGGAARQRLEGKKSSFGLARLFKAVNILPDVPIPSEKLHQPPSIADGCDVETEKSLRFLGCELIQAMSILLKLPQPAAATGQILYQRYFYSKSFVRNNFEHVAMACVNLASKIEEAPRRPRDTINVFHMLKQTALLRSINKSGKRPKPMMLDQNYINTKNMVIKAERRVLKELGFCVHVKHPHKILVNYLKALDSLTNELLQRAWNYMNDALRTNIFVRHSTETITCAIVFLAARVDQVPLPMEPRPWWELFDVIEADILDVVNSLLLMYSRTRPVNWARLEKAAMKLKDDFAERQKAARVAVPETDAVNSAAASPTITSTNSASNNRGDSKTSPSSRNGSPKYSRRRGDDDRRGSPNSKQYRYSGKSDGRNNGKSSSKYTHQHQRNSSRSPFSRSPHSRSTSPVPQRHRKKSSHSKRYMKDRERDRIVGERISKKDRRNNSPPAMSNNSSKYDRSSSPPSSPPQKYRSGYGNGDANSGGAIKDRSRQLSELNSAGSGNDLIHRKRDKRSDRSRSRERRMAQKEREREVKNTLSKRKRSHSPVIAPELNNDGGEYRKSSKKSSRY